MNDRPCGVELDYDTPTQSNSVDTDHILDYIYGFFFSSRRRHTSSKRDWSSDVCSSDLRELEGEIESLRRSGSTVPNNLMAIRAELAAGTGLSEKALPFAAELIEVDPDQAR